MNSEMFFVSNITNVSGPDRYGTRTMVADIEYNGRTLFQASFSITADSFASIVEHGCFQAVVI